MSNFIVGPEGTTPMPPIEPTPECRMHRAGSTLTELNEKFQQINRREHKKHGVIPPYEPVVPTTDTERQRLILRLNADYSRIVRKHSQTPHAPTDDELLRILEELRFWRDTVVNDIDALSKLLKVGPLVIDIKDAELVARENLAKKELLFPYRYGHQPDMVVEKNGKMIAVDFENKSRMHTCQCGTRFLHDTDITVLRCPTCDLIQGSGDASGECSGTDRQHSQ